MSTSERGGQLGFTLIELVLVMLLTGALAGAGALLIVQPFEASRDMTERAALTDQADLAVDRMLRELRRALPNSVRVSTAGGRTAVEFVPTRTGGRYRRLPAPGGGSDPLARSRASDTFDVLGPLPEMGTITPGGGGLTCGTDATDCMNIYNTGQTGFDVYDKDNIAEITAVDTGNNRLTYQNDGSQPAFRAHSPGQRFFVFNDVVSYVCEPAPDGGRLLRHATYGLHSGQPVTATDFGGLGSTPSLVADSLTGCTIEYDPGTSTRQGLVKLDIELTRSGESVTLFAQAHVVNVP